MSDWFIAVVLIVLGGNTVVLALAGINTSKAIRNLVRRIEALEATNE